MQHTGYVARVLFAFFLLFFLFLTYALLHAYVGGGHIKAGTLQQYGKVARFWMAFCPHGISAVSPDATPADPTCCPTELHLVVESSSVPKEKSCGFCGLKASHLNQKALPLAQRRLRLRRTRAPRAAPPQAPIPQNDHPSCITLQPVTKAFKSVLRHVKRWPNFHKMPSKGNREHFGVTGFFLGCLSTGR